VNQSPLEDAGINAAIEPKNWTSYAAFTACPVEEIEDHMAVPG